MDFRSLHKLALAGVPRGGPEGVARKIWWMSKRWKPSVTVAAIIEHEGRFLLVEEHTPEGLMLNNPAGHLDAGESPQEGVVREALEETARVFTPDRLVGVYLSRFQRPAVLEPPRWRLRRGAAPRGGAAALEAAQRPAGEDVTFLRFAFGGSVGNADAGRPLDAGIVRTLWLSLDEIRASRERHRSPLVVRCIEDFVAGRRYPLELISVDPSLYAPQIKG